MNLITLFKWFINMNLVSIFNGIYESLDRKNSI